jgi:hypothetical protein
MPINVGRFFVCRATIIGTICKPTQGVGFCSLEWQKAMKYA